MSGPTENPPAFETSENLLAKKLGVPRKKLAAARFRTSLAAGADWLLVKGQVAYSATGLQKIMGALGLDGQITEGPEKNPQKKEDADCGDYEAVVTRRFTNRHLLEVRVTVQTAQDAARGIPAVVMTVRVIVRDSKNFKIGMAIPVAQDLTTGVWRVTRRAPRSPGKW